MVYDVAALWHTCFYKGVKVKCPFIKKHLDLIAQMILPHNLSLCNKMSFNLVIFFTCNFLLLNDSTLFYTISIKYCIC